VRVRGIEEFDDLGFAGPFPLGTAAQMKLVALHVIDTVFRRPGPSPESPSTNRHLDSPVVAQLCTHPAVIEKVVPILGPDLVVWRSVFFAKKPENPEIAWHQDGHFWDIDPPVGVTAWIAIDRAHLTDRCLELVPGSHKLRFPHTPAPADTQFDDTVDTDAFDPKAAVPVEVDAGSFLLFDLWTLHHSPPGGGEGRRLALSVRITRSSAKIDPALLPRSGEVLSVPHPA
jgi:non-heme Fe2+,alpha-ketoglutarate-dependent halogenase